jgi:hypothetical protein
MPIAEGGLSDQYLGSAKYLAISYCRGAYKTKSRKEERDLGPQMKASLLKNLKTACDELDVHAY